MNSQRALRRELKAAGASKNETTGLLSVASQLEALTRPSEAEKQASRWPLSRLIPSGITVTIGLIIGVVLVAYAQTALPGSWAYPIKRASEQAAVSFDPAYRATLMMRRAEEVKTLINSHASQSRVLATLADYSREANAYKSANYATLDYCKTNLIQAAAHASTFEKTAIASSLADLKS